MVFEFATVSSLVSATDKEKRVSFDRSPDLDRTFDLLKKGFNLHQNSPAASFGSQPRKHRPAY